MKSPKSDKSLYLARRFGLHSCFKPRCPSKLTNPRASSGWSLICPKLMNTPYLAFYRIFAFIILWLILTFILLPTGIVVWMLLERERNWLLKRLLDALPGGWGWSCSWICDTGMSFKQSTLTISTQQATWWDFTFNWSEVPRTRSTLKTYRLWSNGFYHVLNTAMRCNSTIQQHDPSTGGENQIKSNLITDPTPRALFWTTSLLIPTLAPPKWGLQFRHPPLDTTSSQYLPYTLARRPWRGMLLALSAF